jgi:hypothetical protein
MWMPARRSRRSAPLVDPRPKSGIRCNSGAKLLLPRGRERCRLEQSRLRSYRTLHDIKRARAPYCWRGAVRCMPRRRGPTFTRPRYLAAGVINPELSPVSALRAAQLLEEGVVVDLDPLIEDAAFIVVAEDVGQLEHDVLPIGWQRSDR